MLLLLAGSVTNRRVKADKEAYVKPHEIGKCPFALIRHKPDPKDVVLLVRNPRYVVTSKSHPRWPNEYVIGWKREEGKAPYGLDEHWEAMQLYLKHSMVLRYEELIDDPNEVQERLGEHFGLEYDRAFTDWPYGDIKAYWTESGGLGTPRAIGNGRGLDTERLTQQEQYSGFRDCCRKLGYRTGC